MKTSPALLFSLIFSMLLPLSSYAQLENSNDWAEHDVSNDESIPKIFLSRFFATWVGYENLSKSIDQTDGSTRGYIVTNVGRATAGLGGHIFTLTGDGRGSKSAADDIAESNVALIFGAYQATFKSDTTMHIIFTPFEIGLSDAAKDSKTPYFKLMAKGFSVDVDTSQPWGTYGNLQMLSFTPSVQDQGHKFDFGFGTPFSAGYMWEKFRHFDVNSELPPDNSAHIDLNTFYLQLKIAAKLNYQLVRHLRIGATYQITAWSSVADQANGYGMDGKNFGGTSVNGYRFNEAYLPGSEYEAHMGYSFGKKARNEVQIFLHEVTPKNEIITLSGASFAGSPLATKAITVTNPNRTEIGLRVRW